MPNAQAHATPVERAKTFASRFAIQDWLLLGYHAYCLVRVLRAPFSEGLAHAQLLAFILLATTFAGIVLARIPHLGPQALRATLYRVALFAPVMGAYVSLRYILPALQPTLLDHDLWAIDNALFGVTPSVFAAQFNTKPVVEWFAFFYYSHFAILCVTVLPGLALVRTERIRQMLLGALLIVIIGQTGYTLVPGYGPYATIDFAEPLHGGFFLTLVLDAVKAGGAQMDIFPSLHTALPTFFFLFAFEHRRHAPFRYVWPVLGFFAINIVGATMFLRWHWAIDVVAGLGLAFFARWAARELARYETRRQNEGTFVAWPPFTSNAR